MYLLGNPCLDWPNAVDYIIARLDNLGRLDAIEITKGQRLAAKQRLTELTKELTILARKSIEKKVLEEKEGTYDPDKYTKDWRRNVYEEQKAKEAEDEKNKSDNSMFKDYNDFNKAQEEGPIPIYNKDGSVR